MERLNGNSPQITDAVAQVLTQLSVISQDLGDCREPFLVSDALHRFGEGCRGMRDPARLVDGLQLVFIQAPVGQAGRTGLALFLTACPINRAHSRSFVFKVFS
jgi:hypothetical protein